MLIILYLSEFDFKKKITYSLLLSVKIDKAQEAAPLTLKTRIRWISYKITPAFSSHHRAEDNKKHNKTKF